MARWIRPSVEPAAAERLERELGVTPLVARLLAARGISEPEEADRFLRPHLSQLHDPYRMRGMRAAVDRLSAACARAEKILIYGDYDADGTTAVVLLRKAIEMAGGQADFHLPHRVKDGYGMREEVIERAARDGVRVIVSVDTGITAGKVVGRANDLGIDSIITDHHLPDGAAPPALAVLNPNQPGCGYPDKNLSGAGVAFKLAQALLGSLGWEPGRLDKVLRSILRIAVIGTVADVVPLMGENRIIVKFGLEGLRRPVNPGLRALLASAGFSPGQAPKAGGVSFRLAPRLNAAGRMDTAADVIELFTVTAFDRAVELAARLDRLNTERQQAEAAILAETLETLPEAPEAAFLVPAGQGWHRGVIGIVAARLVERFHRPAAVVSIDPVEGVAHGSGRSIRAFHLHEALESMKDLFLGFGGHRQAAGFSLRADRVDELRRRLEAFAAARLTAEDFIPEVRIDADLPLAGISDETMAALAQLEPHGFGNPEPVFAAGPLRVSSEPRVLKEKHLGLALWQGGRILRAVGWRMAERAAALRPGALVAAAFTIQPDDYAGGWQLELRDVMPWQSPEGGDCASNRSGDGRRS